MEFESVWFSVALTLLLAIFHERKCSSLWLMHNLLLCY